MFVYQAVNKELTRLTTVTKHQLTTGLPPQDPRLLDVVSYMVANDANLETMIKRALLEKISYLPTLDSEQRCLACLNLNHCYLFLFYRILNKNH